MIGIPEGEEREKWIENVFEEITAENFPNLNKETDIQVQEAWRVPNKINLNRPTPRLFFFSCIGSLLLCTGLL